MSSTKYIIICGIAFIALVTTLYFFSPESNALVANGIEASTHKRSSKDNSLLNAESYHEFKKQRRKEGYAKMDAPEQHALIERMRRTPTDRTSPEYPQNYKLNELAKAKNAKRPALKSSMDFDFIERGPGNVAGRTRALLVLPSDPSKNTWLAASASGGIWKTTNKGESWEDKTADFPSLGTNTLAMSKSDPNVIYAGTGEHFTRDIDGIGLFKSLDEGETWTQIVAAGDYDAFRNISRIAVDPDDVNTVIVTSRNSVFEDSLRAAIYKTTDGGITWDLKRFSTEERYDDIAVNPFDKNSIYVAVQGEGVIKSLDQGETWEDKSKGLQITGRIEIASSTLDSGYVWASAQGSRSGTGSDLYLSKDAGESWQLAVDEDEAIHFLAGQGWYDNVIEPHPFSKNIAYVGGVNLFKMSVSESETTDIVYEVEDKGAFEFIDFINGANVGGGFIEGELPNEERVSIELRFGQGGQKAHRFSVGGRGSGVPAADYAYQDLVDIPFTAWDITNNIQLMVSFRDQADDGAWNLKERTLNSSDTPNDSREYIFVHNVPYTDTTDMNISVDGGHEYRQLFLMWPAMQDGANYDPYDSPVISFSILAELTSVLSVRTTAISDAYDDFDGNNSFNGSRPNSGHHPDQHSLTTIVLDSTNKSFNLLTTNDGGVYFSNISKDPGTSDNAFRYGGFGYNTTQFYGADKMPGEDRYVGGMQDNATFLTRPGDEASATSFYQFAIGGDGFEAIWNNRDPDLIIGCSQFNGFARSTDGGETWRNAESGISDQGPFYSRVANNRSNPDRLFTLGSSGVWVSNNFGLSWEGTPINQQWSFNNNADIDVSIANKDIIWAGGAMDEFERLFVSTDGGRSFNATSYYQESDLGSVSGIGTHPIEDETAYALFSFARRPKVLKTTDLGQTWQDISGFGPNTGVSSKGFPDVAVNCILVFPNDTNRIWVGSEIGIIESLDGGDSWALLESNFPSVNVYDFKIQDDQIVIATYGRGIWSVTVEGIEQEYIFAPNITDANISPSGGLTLDATIGHLFDSLSFTADDTPVGSTLKDIVVGEGTFGIGDFDLADGGYDFTIIGYLNGEQFESSPFEAFVFAPREPTAEYFNDFSDEARHDDFIGGGFSVRLENGFSDPAIHSDHNYSDQGSITYQLKIPIIVSEQQTFKYKDVVIVEPGENLADFGSQDFFDYVVAEGSIDGTNWRPLADGYDSGFNPSWTSTYNNEGAGRASLFVEHEVDLKDRFVVNDTIFIRYRLFADPFVNGWGWAIDNVAIELESTTPIFDPSFETLSVYPNPTSDFFIISLPEKKGDTTIRIRDLKGSLINSYQLQAQDSKLEISTTNMSSGLYIIDIVEEGKLVATEKVVITR